MYIIVQYSRQDLRADLRAATPRQLLRELLRPHPGDGRLAGRHGVDHPAALNRIHDHDGLLRAGPARGQDRDRGDEEVVGRGAAASEDEGGHELD